MTYRRLALNNSMGLSRHIPSFPRPIEVIARNRISRNQCDQRHDKSRRRQLASHVPRYNRSNNPRHRPQTHNNQRELVQTNVETGLPSSILHSSPRCKNRLRSTSGNLLGIYRINFSIATILLVANFPAEARECG